MDYYYLYINIFISSILYAFFCNVLIIFPLKRWKPFVMWITILSMGLLSYELFHSMILMPLLLCIVILFLTLKEPYPLINIINGTLGYMIGCFIIYQFALLILRIFQFPQTDFYFKFPELEEFILLLMPIAVAVPLLLWIRFLLKKNQDFLLKYVYTKSTSSIVAALFFLFTLIYSVLNTNVLSRDEFSTFIIEEILFLLMFFVIILIIIIMIRSSMDKQRSQLREENYQLLQNYMTNLETEYLQIRGVKHDFANILVSMYSYIELEDMSGLKKFYREHLLSLQESMHSEHAQLAALSQIQSEELKSLLYGKLSHALYCQLHVSVEVPQAVVFPDWVNLIELNRVLGIFLDNAMEVALDSAEKTLQVSIVVNSDHLCFLIANSCPPHYCDMDKTATSHDSSKDSCRGLELSQAKKLLDKDKRFVLKTKLDGTIFLQRLEIY